MFLERRKKKRSPCTIKIEIFLSKLKGESPESALLSGNLMDISSHGATLSLPQILDNYTHLAYTAMESKELFLHVILYHHDDQKITFPVEVTWFNRSLAEHLAPFRIGVEFLEPLTHEQLKQLT